MKATKMSFAQMPREYEGLVAMYPPRPLHDEVEERNAEEIVMEMAGHELSADQEDYLDLLSDLLLKYQGERGMASQRVRRRPADRLKYLMEQSGMTAGELAKVLGCSQPLVSLILSGKRNLSKRNVKKLAGRFGVEAGWLL